MFRFDNILEHWAEIYKPIAHTDDPAQKHKAFYRCDTISSESAFVRNFNTAVSPAVAYITSIDAQFSATGVATHAYGFYLMMKQRTLGMAKSDRQREGEEAECKAALFDMLTDLVAYLTRLKRAATSGQIKDRELVAGLVGLNLDTLSCASVPERYNGWWLLGVQVDCVVQPKRCVAAEKYKDGTISADGMPITIEV